MAVKYRKLATNEKTQIANFVEMSWFLIVTAGQAIRNDRDDLKVIAKEAKAVRDVVLDYLDELSVEDK